jgi:hypothetical protein
MSPLGVAVGVLVEQLPRRNRTLTGEPSLSSNVLYAIAVIDVVAKFGINAVRAQEALLDKARADVPQTSAPFEAMQHFRKVWYRPHGTGAVDVVKMRAMTDRGSLTVSPDGLRFEGNWTSFDLADIARVSLRRSGKDFVNNWAVVECADGRTAQFADGRNHGWSGILGGTRKIFDAIAGIARQPAQP